MICAGLAVVGRVVLQHGREPESCHAELSEIVEVLAQALKVAAVTQRGLRAVHLIGVEALDLKVLAARCEAVGHEHVEHVGVGEALTVFALHVASLQLIVDVGLVLARLEAELHGAGLRVLDVHVDKQIVGTVETHERVDLHAGIVGRHLGRADVLAIHHQLNRRVLHSHIPVGGFYAVNFLCCVHSECSS